MPHEAPYLLCAGNAAYCGNCTAHSHTDTDTDTHTQRHPFTLELGRIELNTQKTEPKLTTKYTKRTKNNTIKRKRKRARKLGRSKEEEEEKIRLICEL